MNNNERVFGGRVKPAKELFVIFIEKAIEFEKNKKDPSEFNLYEALSDMCVSMTFVEAYISDLEFEKSELEFSQEEEKDE
jgi:hypothetical protein